ncbi:MAG: cytochrome C biogenesis protein [Firmicutes bacterium HGW-Firmicutes-3]|jgi:cytochrome c-type biogenesis protein|nr:MAG: cytochrome C biogenesis protein [Firmicutes bacterium HGW-Firmicutes-3]
MKKWIILVLMTSLLTLAACGKEPEVNTVDEENQEKILDDATTQEAATTSQPAREVIMAPDFTLTSSTGEPISLSDYRGKIVFLNFWTTWCKYCLEEMPDFQEAYEKYGDDLEILLVNVTTDENTDREGVIDWYEQFDYTMPMVLDEEGDVTSQFTIPGYPTTYFIDRDGSIIAYYPGLMSTELIDEVMEEFK